MLFQRNANGVSVAIHVQDLEPEPRGTVPESPSHIDVSGATCEVGRRQRPAPRNQTSIASIPESVTEMLQSLVELQQKAALQSSAFHNLKSRALASSSPSKSLLEEIETHHIEMERTLAILIAFGCKGSSVAIRAKEELRLKVRSNIEDIKDLGDVLINASTSDLPVRTRKVISVDKLGEVLDCKDTVHDADTNGRRALYPLLTKFQLVLAARLVPSACPGLSGPFAPALKQPSAEVLEGQL
jgi:hypothetical protein